MRKRMKLGTLASLLATGGLLFSSCGLTDVRESMVAGFLGGVSAYTGTVLTGLLPTPPDVFP